MVCSIPPTFRGPGERRVAPTHAWPCAGQNAEVVAELAAWRGQYSMRPSRKSRRVTLPWAAGMTATVKDVWL